MKKTGLIIVGVIAFVAVCLIGLYISTHNQIIALEEKVNTTYSDVKVQLQRRADLMPNLVNTVKGYTSHEEKIIQEITDARAAINGANSVKELSEADQKLTTALNNLNIIVENYPDLKSSQNFIALQDELAGTENRVATARRDYNEAVKEYNTKIKTIPASIIAGMMGAQEKEYFEVTDSSKEEVPEVNFD